MRHILSSEFEDALRLEDGVLHPVLSLAHKDKDVILEIRHERVSMVDILPRASLSATSFWVSSRGLFSHFCNLRLIGCHPLSSFSPLGLALFPGAKVPFGL